MDVDVIFAFKCFGIDAKSFQFSSETGDSFQFFQPTSKNTFTAHFTCHLHPQLVPKINRYQCLLAGCNLGQNKKRNKPLFSPPPQNQWWIHTPTKMHLFSIIEMKERPGGASNFSFELTEIAILDRIKREINPPPPPPLINDEFTLKPKRTFFPSLKWRETRGGTQICHLNWPRL